MSIKLTDTQLVILSTAAQREDRCLVTPKSLKGGAAQVGIVRIGRNTAKIPAPLPDPLLAILVRPGCARVVRYQAAVRTGARETVRF